MTEVMVRRAMEDDADAIVGVNREMMELHQQVEPAVWTMTPDADDAYRRHLLRCLTDTDRMIAVAVRAGEVLGFIHASKGERPPILQPAVEGIVNAIGVTEFARRQGVGRMLVAEAMRWFAEQGLTIARASWAINNPLSGPFWVAQGFRPYQTTGVRTVGAAAEAQTAARAAGLDTGEDYFAAIARSYDRLQPVLVGPGYALGLGMLVDLVPHEMTDAFAFVELGCGTATLTRMVLERFPNATAVAIDGESAMLEIARQKLVPHRSRAEVRQADVLSCELPTSDLVISSFMFHHIPPDELNEVLARIAGALRPGGCLILLDQMVAGLAWSTQIGGQSRRVNQRYVAAALARGTVTQEELDARVAFKREMKEQGKNVEFRHSAERIIETMQAAGFDEVGLVWRMFANTIIMAFVAEGEN